MTTAIADAVGSGTLAGRVWMYSNYHCNLVCTYCLTASAPTSPRRHLSAAAMAHIADEAAELGFTDLGVTGGEPFLRPDMVDVLLRVSSVLPTIVLSNATLFRGARLDRLAALAGADVAIQVSLDSADAEPNDTARGDGGHRLVVEAIPRLVDLGVRVRIATTVDPAHPPSTSDQARLCELHRSLGVSDDDHVVRPVVRRGRAADGDMGVRATIADLPPELTITADGAFWSPFGPTVTGGRVDTDLLLTRTTTPLLVPATALLRIVEGRPPGDDAHLGIR